jgi:hypothetical protein
VEGVEEAHESLPRLGPRSELIKIAHRTKIRERRAGAAGPQMCSAIGLREDHFYDGRRLQAGLAR